MTRPDKKATKERRALIQKHNEDGAGAAFGLGSIFRRIESTAYLPNQPNHEQLRALHPEIYEGLGTGEMSPDPDPTAGRPQMIDESGPIDISASVENAAARARRPGGSTGSGNPAPTKRTRLEEEPDENLSGKQAQAKRYQPKRATKDMSKRIIANLRELEKDPGRTRKMKYYKGTNQCILDSLINEANDTLYALGRSPHGNNPEVINRIKTLMGRNLVESDGATVQPAFINECRQFAVDFSLQQKMPDRGGKNKGTAKPRPSAGGSASGGGGENSSNEEEEEEEEEEDEPEEADETESTDQENIDMTRSDYQYLEYYERIYADDDRIPKCIRLQGYNARKDRICDKIRLEFFHWVKSLDTTNDEKEVLEEKVAEWKRLDEYDFVERGKHVRMSPSIGTQTRISMQPVLDEMARQRKMRKELADLEKQHAQYESRRKADEEADRAEEAAAVRALQEIQMKRLQKQQKNDSETAKRIEKMKALGWKSPPKQPLETTSNTADGAAINEENDMDGDADDEGDGGN